jgi:hypothetical protein
VVLGIQVVSQQQKKQSEESGRDVSTSRDKISTVKEYTAAYAACMVNASGEVKRRLEKAESELREKGFSESELQSIQGSVKKSVRTDLSKTIKEAFLRKMLAKGKNLDAISASKNLNDALAMGEGTRGVASGSFDGLKGLAKEQLEAARSEAKDFVLEELELKLIEKILSGQTKELDDHIKDLVILAMKLGVDMSQFMVNWKKKKVDLGFR